MNSIKTKCLQNTPSDLVQSSCKQSLTNHMRIHSGLEDAPYLCHVCFKRFYSNGSLRGHFLTHQNIKRTICSKCNGVLYPGSFVEHCCSRLALHNDYVFRDNKFRCPLCDESFRTKEEFSSHRKNHIKIKSFTCDICQKNFFRKIIFRKHMESHISFNLEMKSNEFFCEICNKKYANKKGLQVHIKTIHNELRYDCNICGNF
uniref:CSON000915 protein n=1 Tax=Culicoides sonorensis TaxID=179676 RepID=A0A336LU82_CULSO